MAGGRSAGSRQPEPRDRSGSAGGCGRAKRRRLHRNDRQPAKSSARFRSPSRTWNFRRKISARLRPVRARHWGGFSGGNRGQLRGGNSGGLARQNRKTFVSSALIDRRYRLFRRQPGVLLPPVGEGIVAAAKNIALGSRNVRDADWIGRAGTQIAFPVAGVLPEAPITPGGARRWLVMIVRDPEPAVSENGFIGSTHAGSVHDRAQPIFAAVNTWIFSGSLFNALDEARGLIDPHGAAGIMAVSFKIEDKKETARLNAGPTPVGGDN